MQSTCHSSLSLAHTACSLVFHTGITMHLKVLGDLYDQVQQTLIQFSDFVERHVGSTCMRLLPVAASLRGEGHARERTTACGCAGEHYSNALPSLAELCTAFNLEPDAAFFLARYGLATPLLLLACDLSASLTRAAAISNPHPPQAPNQPPHSSTAESPG